MSIETGAAAPLPAYSGVFVFGDSLVDPGNDLKAANLIGSFPFANVPNGAPTADKGYFDGRFTDGYNFADLVSNKVLFAATQTTFPYGVSNILGVSTGSVGRPDGNNLSFAYGGASALSPTGGPAPTLQAQISTYDNFDVDPNALYLVSIGANDVLSLVPTGGAPVTGAQAQAQIAAVAQEITQQVAHLIARGVQHVMVADVPDVGVTPAYTGSDDEATRRALLSQYAQALDAQLKADLAALAVPAGTTVQTYDFLGYTDAAVGSPTSYHFTNVTQALTSVQPTSPDPTGGGFLFFDKLHPTAEAHAQIASQILAQLAGGAAAWTQPPAIGAQAAGAVPLNGGETFTANLVAGHTYVMDALGVSTASGTLADPLLRILDGSGALVTQADDGGVGLDSHLVFTPSASGAYTVEVRGVGVTSGTFHLQAEDGNGANMLLTGVLQGSNVAIQGGPANDTLTAIAGDNTLFGATGADSIVGGAGFDRVNGNQGDDLVVGRSAVGDWLLGGQGQDRIDATASSGHNILNGNLANDTLLAGSGGDTLRGGQGDDTILGGAGSDRIFGDLGHNTLTGGLGADTFHESPGVDVITDFQQAQGDQVLLDPGVTYTLSQSGADALVVFSDGGQMRLVGVQSTSLTTGWIVGG